MEIVREEYLDWLRKAEGLKLIKVITGARRVGKSTILAQFRHDLKKRGVKAGQIQSYNFEERETDELGDWRALYDRIVARLVPDNVNYIFLDEIQNVSEFEKAVNALFVRENVDIYITGSNAYMLSGELATYLSGRYLSLHLLPFSFKEYAQNFPEEIDKDKLFDRYLASSSFPEAVQIAQHDMQMAQNYLHDLYDTIVKKDIMARHAIRNQAEFEKVVRFICDSVGSLVSLRNISNMLGETGSSTFHGTVAKYLEYLIECYMIYPVRRYDIKGKKILTTTDKYYLVDLGLRDLLLNEAQMSNRGHKLENVVYLELKRRNVGEIYVGKGMNAEVDFMVKLPRGAREYYQVAYDVSSPETLRRELAPLQKIPDNYPKFLITRDTYIEELGGIQKMNVVEWLLKNQDKGGRSEGIMDRR